MFAKGSCLPERSARRSATVTNSLPLAMSASRINSFDANFPVPTSRRDANSRSAIFSFEGLSATRKDKRIHEHARISKCSMGILPVWPIGILPVDYDRHAFRSLCVIGSSAGETHASLTDKMSVLLSFRDQI